ncbi:MAG: hypothetical protein SGJ18_14880 [Pseudomonadota bacterium]|nr:hypothetical protein [Pseudomonadota bacterium]
MPHIVTAMIKTFTCTNIPFSVTFYIGIKCNASAISDGTEANP